VNKLSATKKRGAKTAKRKSAPAKKTAKRKR
jgi:hypothetical protein